MADSNKIKAQAEIKKMELDISQVTRTTSLLNQNQIQKIWNSTPARFKYERPAKGGGTWTYIKISYVRKVLDSVFGFNWTFDVDTSLKDAFDVASVTGTCVVKGTLTGYVKSDGVWVPLSKTQFGRAEVKFKRTILSGIIEKAQKALDLANIDLDLSPLMKPVPLDFGNDMKAATSDCLKKCASLFGIGADVYEAGEFQEIEITGSDDNNDRKKNLKQKIKDAQAVLDKEGEEVSE